MKYLEFPVTSLSIPSGLQWAHNVIYRNNTNSYVLVEGITWNDIWPPNPASSYPYSYIIGVEVWNRNNASMDIILRNSFFLTQQSGTIPVWNGTTMENESASLPTEINTFIYKVGETLCPPQGQIVLVGICTTAHKIAVSGWGFLLDEEELKDFVIHKIRKNLGDP